MTVRGGHHVVINTSLRLEQRKSAVCRPVGGDNWREEWGWSRGMGGRAPASAGAVLELHPRSQRASVGVAHPSTPRVMSRESDPSGAPTCPGIRWPTGGALNARLNSLFPLQEGVSRSSFPCCCSCCCRRHPWSCSRILGCPHQVGGLLDGRENPKLWAWSISPFSLP